MRKDLGDKMQFMPLPVLMLATYDQDGKANVMNAAWGGVYDYNQVYVSLSKHKTTDNLELKKAFTLSFATKKTEKISDYFGVVSGNEEDILNETLVDIGINQVACTDNVIQREILFYHNQCSYLTLTHIQAGHHDRHDVFFFCVRLFVAFQETEQAVAAVSGT